LLVEKIEDEIARLNHSNDWVWHQKRKSKYEMAIDKLYTQRNDNLGHSI